MTRTTLTPQGIAFSAILGSLQDNPTVVARDIVAALVASRNIPRSRADLAVGVVLDESITAVQRALDDGGSLNPVEARRVADAAVDALHAAGCLT